MQCSVRKIVLYLSISLAVASCSTMDEDLSTSSNPVPVAVINSSSQGAQAASALIKAKELAVSSTELLKSLGLLGLKVMTPSLTGVDTDLPCADYGTYKYTGTYDSANDSYALTLTFSLCRESGLQYDGSYTLAGTTNSITVTLGSSSSEFRIFTFNDDYTTLINNMKVPGLTYTMAKSGMVADEAYTINSNGSISAFDYFLLGQHNLSYKNFKTEYTKITSGTGNQTIAITANGFFSESWTSTALFISYSNLKVDIVKQYSAAIPGFYADDTTISGTVALDYRPNATVEGSISVVTDTAIRKDYAAGDRTQGKLTINGTTVTYNGNGSIDVKAGSDATSNYLTNRKLMKLSNFFAMEREVPPIVGKYGSASGSTMTITALSVGSDLNCYTDVHVNYYSTTSPQGSDTLSWNVDWHTGQSCTPPSGIPFEESKDTDGDGYCDSGLDINGADKDLTSGGVEHYTSTKLPSGYYVIAINNYSCNTSTTNMASVLIGDDYLFSTYNCTYSASDGEAQALGAWCRLADVKVNADGTVDVLSPNLLLNPWHL